MRRLLTWIIGLAGAEFVTFWLFPASRAVLNVFPPARVAIDAILPAPPVAENAPAEPKSKGRGPQAAPVTVATVVLGDMPVILSAPGTVDPYATVTVKTRVDGQIAEVLFKEGDLVQKDQVLFRLDERLIVAQIRQAEANIKRDQANLTEAMATLDRRSALVQKRIVSEAAAETAKALVENLKASIAAGQAALEAQKTQLDYLVIKAPIAGRTGAAQFKAGANVRAADTIPLVVINQIKPIAVVFSLPQTELVALKTALAVKAEGEVLVSGSVPLMRTGRLEFIDNQVDKQTGALAAKLLVPNEDEALWPGQAVQILLKVEIRKNMLSLPASAVLPSQQGMMVWVVGADNKATTRTVVLDRIVGQTAYVTDGVKPGETVVTDGQLRLAPNATVTVRDPAAPKGPAPATKKEERGKGSNEKRS